MGERKFDLPDTVGRRLRGFKLLTENWVRFDLDRRPYKRSMHQENQKSS
jgi:hypothetical protein